MTNATKTKINLDNFQKFPFGSWFLGPILDGKIDTYEKER